MTYSTLNFEREWDLRYAEALAVACGEPTLKDAKGAWIISDPAPRQKSQARADADAACKRLRDEIKALHDLRRTFELDAG